MKLTNLVTYGTLCLLACLLLVYVIPNYCPAYEGDGVPASLLPEALSWIILALSAGLFIVELLKKRAEGTPAPIGPRQLLHIGTYLAAFVGVLILMRYVGYIVAIGCSLCFFQYLMGQRRPVVFVALVLLVPTSLYAAIWYGLRVPLP